MNIWLPALACIVLIIYLLLQRTSGSEDKSAERLALLVGARRAWGETDAHGMSHPTHHGLSALCGQGPVRVFRTSKTTGWSPHVLRLY